MPWDREKLLWTLFTCTPSKYPTVGGSPGGRIPGGFFFPHSGRRLLGGGSSSRLLPMKVPLADPGPSNSGAVDTISGHRATQIIKIIASLGLLWADAGLEILGEGASRPGTPPTRNSAWGVDGMGRVSMASTHSQEVATHLGFSRLNTTAVHPSSSSSDAAGRKRLETTDG